MIPKIPKNIDDTLERGFEKVEKSGEKLVQKTTEEGQKATEDFVNQLYAPTNPSEQSSAQKPEVGQSPQYETQGTQHMEAEKEKLGKAEQQLPKTVSNQYEVNYHQEIASLEQSLKRLRAKQQQEEAQKKQQEEEEQMKKEEEKKKQMAAVPMPSGKQTGLPLGAKQRTQEAIDKDIALQRAQQSRENKSGFSG